MSLVERIRSRPLAGPVALLCAGWLVTVLLFPWNDRSITDVWLYSSYGAQMAGGHLPYRDFFFEYPPLAAPVLALPSLPETTGQHAYEAVFGAIMLAFGVGCLVLCARLAELTGADARRAAYAFALLPLASGALAREHLDLAPLALTLAGLALMASRRSPTGGFAVLGLGAMTKVFPALAALPVLSWLWARGRRDDAVRGLVAMGAVVVAVVAATYAVSPAGTRNAWEYQAHRPVQIESVPAVVLQAIDAAGGPEVRRFLSHNGDALTSSAAGAVGAASFALLLGALGLVSLLAARGPRDGPAATRHLVLAALAAVAVLPALGKVLSPQFLIWTWPLFAMAVAWGERLLAALLLGATLLTFVEFPFNYYDVAAGDATAVLLVAVRNALLLAALGVACARLARSSARGHEQLLDRARATVVARFD